LKHKELSGQDQRR